MMTYLLIAVFIVGFFGIALRIFVYDDFNVYIAETELAKLDHLEKRLKKEYRIHGGWDHFFENPMVWHEVHNSSLMKDHDVPNSDAYSDMPVPKGREGDPFAVMRHPFDPLQIGPRLRLFDADMNPVIGRTKADSCVLRKIMLDGRTVGWFGIIITDHFYHPLDIRYLKGQLPGIFMIIAGTLTIALLLAFFLSRHLLGPVRSLTEGTKALADLKLDTKIDIMTNDELGALAADFNKMAQMLKNYETMRSQWIADISHELRTPLAVLRGETEAMLDGVRDMNHRHLNSLHSETLRLNNLVNDLHQLSMVDSQSLYIEKEPVRPLSILTDTIRLFQKRFEQKQIEIRTNTYHMRDESMPGDKNRLIQLFVNLFENTLRYTDSPGILDIHADIGSKALTVRFEDSAPGVPDAELERIFDRLYRVDKSRSRELGGSGLGLSICRQIVENHGGSMWAAHSQPGGLGICMKFSFA